MERYIRVFINIQVSDSASVTFYMPYTTGLKHTRKLRRTAVQCAKLLGLKTSPGKNWYTKSLGYQSLQLLGKGQYVSMMVAEDWNRVQEEKKEIYNDWKLSLK